MNLRFRSAAADRNDKLLAFLGEVGGGFAAAHLPL
jgi:hypothetical protein